ncbi:MAG: N-acetylmuramoyl-L-alanine amidase [Pseudomonadota bacterium]
MIRLVVALLLVAAPTVAAELERVRLGVHDAFTRVVIETSRSLRPEVPAPADDRLRVVVPARAAASLVLPRPRGLVTAITATEIGAATELVLRLRSRARVASRFALAPGSSGAHRYVIDLAVSTPPARDAPAAEAPKPTTVAAPAPLRAEALAPTEPPPAASPVDAAPASDTGGTVVAAATPPRLPVPRLRPAPGATDTIERRPVVVIDAGHGGVDPGALSPLGFQEKRVTLDVARRLRDRLVAADQVEVVMTRDDDRSLSLARRLTITAEAQADLFVSLHADSLPSAPEVAGASVYTLSEQPSDADAARKARTENAADERLQVIAYQEDETVRDILTSMMRTSTTHRSSKVARIFATEIARVTPLVKRGQRSANFVVLRSLQTPSVLVELGYLSNVEDASVLRDPEHLDRLADALFRSVTAAVELE